MKELKESELELVSGGLPFVLGPALSLAVSVGTRFVTSQLVRHYASSASIAYGTYDLAKSLDRD
ncbi:hypothetical protein [Microbulbifer yueqingensis]|uniref:Uncharacterized protein n=1 Tax=Microbulbifer yueqingensis TaxID=658219 RepID=A0A1G8VMM1_9GAMM|nr:hypothetical protein [Microbulbifer yueqingensis]SDJ66430.1 hypothetical protein SAMN05216212_0607 [Microbulbifer yueqingensis]